MHDGIKRGMQDRRRMTVRVRGAEEAEMRQERGRESEMERKKREGKETDKKETHKQHKKEAYAERKLSECRASSCALYERVVLPCVVCLWCSDM